MENQIAVAAWVYFWDLYSIPVVYVSVLMTIHAVYYYYYYYYYCFVEYFAIRYG
jgi:hypothetical protein